MEDDVPSLLPSEDDVGLSVLLVVVVVLANFPRGLLERLANLPPGRLAAVGAMMGFGK